MLDTLGGLFKIYFNSKQKTRVDMSLLLTKEYQHFDFLQYHENI